LRAQQASVLARTLEDFVADGVLDATMATLLRATVRTRKNIVIHGQTGCWQYFIAACPVRRM